MSGHIMYHQFIKKYSIGNFVTAFAAFVTPFVTPFAASAISTITDSSNSDIQYSRLFRHRDITDFNHTLTLNVYQNNKHTLLTTDKHDLRTLTHLITGCNYLRYFQHKIGNEPSAICNKCEDEVETTAHYIMRCPAFAI